MTYDTYSADIGTVDTGMSRMVVRFFTGVTGAQQLGKITYVASGSFSRN